MSERAPTPLQALHDLWTLGAGDPAALDRVDLEGADPVLPSRFRVGTAAQASLAAVGLAAAELWRARGGRAQRVALAMRDAAVAFRSERYLRVDGQALREPFGAVGGFHRAGDGRWLQIHAGFAHHAAAACRVLGCAEDRAAVTAALQDWSAAAFEQALAEAGGCGALVRSPQEWRDHPQRAALVELPLVSIERIGDAPPEPFPPTQVARPLAGLRVLDLTRVIAGPVCGRSLAAQGAEVLRIAAPHLPSKRDLVIDTGRGKRSAWVDLDTAAGHDAFRRLLGGADVFVQSYRPGSLAARGFDPQALAAMRPGLVQVALSAYGEVGPWGGRRGFDSLVQCVSGIAWEEGEAAGTDGPRHLPCQALDHASGQLAAFGALIALRRRAREGGNWLVRVSLARTSLWLQGLGRVDGLAAPDLSIDDVADLLATDDTAFGRVTHVRPVLSMSETPPRWDRPPVPLGSDPPAWDEATTAREFRPRVD